LTSFFTLTVGREQLLSEEDLLIIQTQLPASIAVCGMAYAMQAQLCANTLTSEGDKASTMSFYDSFSLWSNTSTAAIYFTNPTPEAVRTVMVSAGAQLDSLTSLPDAVSPACAISLTGNPTLESWATVDADEGKKQITRKVLYGDDNWHTIGIIFAGNIDNPSKTSISPY
jgi:hypothetical protein